MPMRPKKSRNCFRVSLTLVIVLPDPRFGFGIGSAARNAKASGWEGAMFGFIDKAKAGARFLIAALALIILLQGLTIWLLLARPQLC